MRFSYFTTPDSSQIEDVETEIKNKEAEVKKLKDDIKKAKVFLDNLKSERNKKMKFRNVIESFDDNPNSKKLKSAIDKSQQKWISSAKKALRVPENVALDRFEMSHSKARQVLDNAGIDSSQFTVAKKYG